MSRSHRRSKFESKSVDRETPQPTFLVAKGEINLDDKSLLAQILGRFGLESAFMTEEQYQQDRKRLQIVVSPETGNAQFRFTSITQPDQYLVREHFEDFRDNVRPDLNPGSRKAPLCCRAFHTLLDGRGSSKMRYWENGKLLVREPEPLPGIVIAKREDLDMPLYQKTITNSMGKPKDLVNYALQAGSIVEYAKSIEANFKHSATENFVLIIATQLKFQFE